MAVDRFTSVGAVVGRAVCSLVLTAGLLVVTGAPVAALDLPTPAGQRELDRILLEQVGARPDRVLVSVVPGPVVNDEQVLVGLTGDGQVQTVRLEQRLRLTGTGDYQVRERGPARAAEPLGDEPPPVTKFGAVVWQGFSPGERELAALLTLDPMLEAARLPLQATVSKDGAPLEPGGRVLGPGQVIVRLENTTVQPVTLPTAADALAAPVAAGLDTALAAASAPVGPRLPAAGGALPAAVPTTGDATVQTDVGVPLDITGTVRLPGATVTGPGTTPLPGGADLSGTLPPGQSVDLLVEATSGGTLDLDLTVTPTLDARTLAPPAGAQTWAAWAAGGPDVPARRAALDLLIQTTAIGARATSFAPYLGADLPGTGTTQFRYGFASVEQAPAAPVTLTPRPGPIAATTLATLLLGVAGVGLWRRS